MYAIKFERTINGNTETFPEIIKYENRMDAEKHLKECHKSFSKMFENYKRNLDEVNDLVDYDPNEAIGYKETSKTTMTEHTRTLNFVMRKYKNDPEYRCEINLSNSRNHTKWDANRNDIGLHEIEIYEIIEI